MRASTFSGLALPPEEEEHVRPRLAHELHRLPAARGDDQELLARLDASLAASWAGREGGRHANQGNLRRAGHR